MINFVDKLVNWYEEHKRDLPWRNDPDPYKVWLSEIILQQTRVNQGLPYYLEFIEAYPTVYDLAAASEEEVLKLWQGLGYYSRARNLHFSAKMVVCEFDGEFPKSYKELKKLKGVGDYTAAAVASICYDEPLAVLDGNVFRVLSRFFGIEEPINTTAGKKIFRQKAQDILDKEHPGRYNQALMEFGALHCKPRNPLCATCPLQHECIAFQQGKIDRLPVKLKKTKIRERHLNYLVFLSLKKETWIQKRVGKGIWKNLYEFPLIESNAILNKAELLENPLVKEMGVSIAQVRLYNTQPVKHQLSHQKLMVRYWVVETSDLPVLEKVKTKTRKSIPWHKIDKFPVPALIHKFLNTFEING